MTVTTDDYIAMIQRSAEAFDATLWGVEKRSQHGVLHFDVFIDADTGVSAELCLQVAKQIRIVLGAEGVARDAITVDVSSPGIQRRFYQWTQCQSYLGQALTCKFHAAGTITGTLQRIEDGVLHFEVADQATLTVPFLSLQSLSLHCGDRPCQP